ncbi:hypothetical protein [Tahibacter harae]|uniref:HEPN AbiU2-like domain-containing protein n=1 Tax=Tahibacter harae TaxID=2963937 RepID=A0ABT1QVV6_9GAMM|nr:hypothetical protein [Tahibacter harae]MCQ4166391.1 hypothetical protein [Tahibacter harae]
MKTPKVSQLFLQLQQEAYLSSSLIASGLTELRRAHVGDRGRYYNAFFHLSIGMERLCKLILILNHLATNHLKPPGIAAIKGFSHDLSNLYRTALSAYGIATTHPTEPLVASFIDFLSTFAKSTRYSNLDALASGNSGVDVLAEWNSLIEVVVAAHVRPRKQKKFETIAALAESALAENSFVLAHDLSGRPMGLGDWFRLPALHDEAAKHAVWIMIQALEPLTDAVGRAGAAAESASRANSASQLQIPDMPEFFYFLYPDRQYVLRKKRWP